MKGQQFRWIVLALSTLVVAVAISACGGGGSSTSASEGSTSASSEETSEEATSGGEEEAAGSELEAEAAKIAEEVEQPPTTVPEAIPLKNTTIPTGKSVAYLGCGVVVCEEYAEIVKEGAEALGWSFKYYEGSVEPNKIVKFLEQIVAAKPDVFIAASIPTSLANKYFKEMQANGAVTVLASATKADTEGITKLLDNETDKLNPGKGLAAFMLRETGEELNALYVNSTSFEVSQPYYEGLKEGITDLCPECGVDEINVSAEDIGKPTLPTEVVSYLRTHPEVNYVATIYPPLLEGLPAAMKAAGIEGVSLAGTASGEVALESIRNGKDFWTANQKFGVEWGLWGLNIALREFNKEPLGPETQTPEVLVTQKNIEEVSPGKGNSPVIPDALEQYEKLWGLK